MISSLKGKIDRISGDYIEVEVSGVGYLVFVGKKNYQIDDEVKIYTYMAVSENEIALYGFENWDDVNLFKMLISVSGVGPKTGAQILAETKSDLIIKAIGNADVDFFQKIKGIGKKTAQRIIIDLKSKIGGLGELDLSRDDNKADDDLTLSLKQLGFDKKEIEKVVKKMPAEIILIEEKISWCLQNLN